MKWDYYEDHGDPEYKSRPYKSGWYLVPRHEVTLTGPAAPYLSKVVPLFYSHERDTWNEAGGEQVVDPPRHYMDEPDLP